MADPVALARAGYVVVVQDVRGRFASDGVLDFGEQEHDDGYDTVEWVTEQPWCNGRVGIYGSSHHAIAAYAAAPPHPEAVFAMTGAADLAPTVRPGGLFEIGFLTFYSFGQTIEQIRRSDRRPPRPRPPPGRGCPRPRQDDDDGEAMAMADAIGGEFQASSSLPTSSRPTSSGPGSTTRGTASARSRSGGYSPTSSSPTSSTAPRRSRVVLDISAPGGRRPCPVRTAAPGSMQIKLRRVR